MSKSNVPEVRTGQGDVTLSREAFIDRAKQNFKDSNPWDEESLNAVIEGLWQRYDGYRKWPFETPAGKDFEDPGFKIGQDWLDTYHRLARAKELHHDPDTRSRILLINGSPRSDNTCPGEMSKTHRLCEAARLELEGCADVEYLDLSRLTSEYGKKIHPCKSCVATAMPLCHWPCSCYPNYALDQTQDWMNEIYEMWMKAHGVMIVTPVHWYSPTSVLKLMMDRMVCADGGNPDFTSTQGKDPAKAKELELKGWRYPKHLAGRRFAVVAHGDAEGAIKVAEAVSGWLSDTGLVSAGGGTTFDRYIGYYEPYATSHEALDSETALFEEVKKASITLTESVGRYREELKQSSAGPMPGLRRSQFLSGSEAFGADHEVRPK